MKNTTLIKGICGTLALVLIGFIDLLIIITAIDKGSVVGVVAGFVIILMIIILFISMIQIMKVEG